MSHGADRDIDATLDRARRDIELDVARYRCWVFGSVTPLTLGVSTLLRDGSGTVTLYFASCFVFALLIYRLVRRLGAPLWLSVAAVVADVLTMAFVFPIAAVAAPVTDDTKMFPVYVLGASLVGILAINFSRANVMTALVGPLVALGAFFAVILPMRGFEPAQLPIAIIIALMGAVGVAMAHRTRTTLESFARTRLLRRFVPEHLLSRVLDAAPDVVPQLGGEEHTVTVLASDLRGFTAMSERLAPPEVVRQLNAYHGVMLEVVRRHGGMLDKFIGDGMLVVFGLRDAATDAGAEAAVSCAREMLDALSELNLTRGREGLDPLRAGIGVHSGPVVAGSIGAGDRLEFTVIGDAVNTAARLEGLTKEAGVSLLVTAATVDRLADAGDLRELPAMSARGKRDALRVFTLVPSAGQMV
ncbi:MAG: adenylate/guanylate cyclase domain-containing protein [Polyangiaceae bacterium]|nr:adenylate/guanylate cyclase domain-containing protein [Polyangiaceae bacterium]